MRDEQPEEHNERWTNILKAIIVRCILVTHSMLCVWRAADVQKNDLYWLLALCNLTVIAEGIIRVFKNNGKEHKWFIPCFLLYIICTLPSLWILEFDRIDRYDDLYTTSNISAIQQEALSTISGITLPVRLEADTWLSLLEQALLLLLIIGRWFLPRGKINRNQLSQLLLVYIAIASDVMELFTIFNEPEVRADRELTIVTLFFWSLCLLQFCIALSAMRSLEEGQHITLCDKIFGTEIWALVIAIFLSDGPFFVIRVYALVVHNIRTYGLLAFAIKNIVMIILLVYRICVVCKMSDEKFDIKVSTSKPSHTN